MSDKVDREGIHIDRDLADEIAIEDELDANVVGPYLFPSPERRRSAGWVFVVAGVIAGLTIDGGWLVAIGFALLALWQFLSAWPLNIDENTAMTVAGGAVDFPVGHASAAVRFHGWRSRPRWAVVLYSASEPPDQRGLVVLDAVNGDVVETPYVETIAPV
jgi:hypothetical protein